MYSSNVTGRIASSAARLADTISVLTQPGQTALTRTPASRISIAAVFDSDTTPALAAP